MQSRFMSDPFCSDIDFKNKMTRVWTILKRPTKYFETFYSASEALRCAWFTRIGNANLYHARRPGAPTGGNVGGGGDGMTNGEPVATKRSKTQN